VLAAQCRPFSDAYYSSQQQRQFLAQFTVPRGRRVSSSLFLGIGQQFLVLTPGVECGRRTGEIAGANTVHLAERNTVTSRC